MMRYKLCIIIIIFIIMLQIIFNVCLKAKHRPQAAATDLTSSTPSQSPLKLGNLSLDFQIRIAKNRIKSHICQIESQTLEPFHCLIHDLN